jgi:hypothetical protein
MMSVFSYFGYSVLVCLPAFSQTKTISATIREPNDKVHGFKKYFSVLLGAALFATSILIYWYGSYTFYPS